AHGAGCDLPGSFLTVLSTAERSTLSLHDALPICAVIPEAGVGQVDLGERRAAHGQDRVGAGVAPDAGLREADLVLGHVAAGDGRSEEHTSERQSLAYLVCRLLRGQAGGDGRAVAE